MAANSIDRVKQSIRERLEELEAERDQLMRALEALTAGTSAVRRRGRPAGSGAGAGSPAKAARPSGGRAARGQRRREVLQVLEGKELGPSGIAREIGGVNPTQISGLLRQLAAEGLVTRTAGGQWRLSGGSASESPATAGPATSWPESRGGGSVSIS